MGTHIDVVCQRLDGDIWIELTGNFVSGGGPFTVRTAEVYRFLGYVSFTSIGIPCITEPRGLPDDYAYVDDYPYFGPYDRSWLSLDEINRYDYDQEMDARYGDECCRMSLRDALGQDFFADLAEINRMGTQRIVYGFD